MKHVPSVRGIETLFVGYMFHNPGGQRLLGVFETLFVGYMLHNPGAASVRGIETLFVGYLFHTPKEWYRYCRHMFHDNPFYCSTYTGTHLSRLFIFVNG